VRRLRLFRVAAIVPIVAGLLAGQTAKPKPKPPAAPAGPPLQLVSPVVSQFEDGTPLEGGQHLIVGEIGFFRFAAVNYKVSDAGKVQLSAKVQVFDSRGTAIAPVDELAIATALSEEDKDWRPRFHSQFQLPGIAPSGNYRVHYEATDEQSHQNASGDASFTVDGPNVAPSDKLAIQQMAFYRGADDEVPIGVAAYRPGDMIWVKFFVTGYKHAQQNAMDVTYDVSVTDAAGKQLFAQENAAVEKNQAFYPQPWVPGAFSLTLQPGTLKATYTVAITARDAIGKQNVTEKAEFKVE